VTRLAGAGIVSEAYRRGLAILARRLVQAELVTVATHNDLTMANIVLGKGNRLGILDWESAKAAALPLGDLWYALADAVARARRITHADAVSALVTRAPGVPNNLVRMPSQHGSALELTVDEQAIGFHACWLGHADNELRRGKPDGPFAAVVAAVARGQLLWSQDI
jgi:thiamine kinase-like enzyme